LVLAGSSLNPAPATAQISFEVVGARALGMAGAFVGVADDATVVHWNPGGLLNGPPYSMTVGWDRLRFGNPDLPAIVGATEDDNKITSIATWPLGISYGHFHWARVVSVAEDGTPTVESLRVHHIGGTVAWTIWEDIVAGATVKYLRGQAITTETEGFLTGEALGQALDRRADSDGAFDIDIGVSANFGPVRIGYTLKNALEPSFAGVAGFAIDLKRRSRLGISVMPVDGLTLAFDVDLDTADPQVGIRRTMALGGEARLGSRFALRGGVRWSRDEGPQPVGAAGLSIMIRRGFWLDGYATYSRDNDRGYGVALRVGG
jgi:hypothetical protein